MNDLFEMSKTLHLIFLTMSVFETKSSNLKRTFQYCLKYLIFKR